MKKVKFLVPFIILFSCNSPKNKTFEVSLPSNSTTGYSWKWINKNPTSFVDTISKTYIATKYKEEIAGSGGNEIWKFRVNAVGIDTLKFEYCRSWEPNSTIETKKFIIKIK